MKRLLLVFTVILLSTLVSKGQIWQPSSVTTNDGSLYRAGKIGIGITTTPTYPLHVGGSLSSVQLRLERTGNDLGSADIGSDIQGLKFWPGGYGGYPKVLFEPDGNVGIGVADAQYKLDIEGFGMRLKNSSTAASNYTSLRLQGGTALPNGLEIDFFGSPNIPSLEWSYGAGVGGAAIVNVNPKPLVLGTNNAPRLFISGDGNVGIGTTTPDPIYKLSVNGSIRAKEIKVNTGWSDFVFFDSYKLRPLSEVETFIQENKHLPDVPSAAVVEKEGVNLGEMDAILLRKIEELTLYMIEINKENEVLKKEILELKERL